MLPHRTTITLAMAVSAFLLTAGFTFTLVQKHHSELPLKDEKEVKVSLDAGFGKITIGRGSSTSLMSLNVGGELRHDIGEYLDYTAEDRIGYLTISTVDKATERVGKGRHGSFNLGSIEDNAWNFAFTDAVPMSFDIKLGMGSGDLDFTGLAVKDLNISTGASSVVIRFDKENRVPIGDLTIETGLSKFKGYGLCNARFKRLRFEGGVGSYVLDFGGNLDRSADVEVEVGLGSITLVIPHEIGVKVYYEKSFVASLDLPDDFNERDDDTYYSENYEASAGRLNFRVDAGLGSVKIRH